jgi:hypothetical protein
MAIPVVPLKREVIEIPSGKHEAVLSPKLNLMCVDGEPHKSTGPVFTPGVVRRGDELAKRPWFLPAIRFHNLKDKPAERASAIRCFPHAGLDESSPHKCPGWRSANWMNTSRGQFLSRRFLTICASFCA